MVRRGSSHVVEGPGQGVFHSRNGPPDQPAHTGRRDQSDQPCAFVTEPGRFVKSNTVAPGLLSLDLEIIRRSKSIAPSTTFGEAAFMILMKHKDRKLGIEATIIMAVGLVEKIESRRTPHTESPPPAPYQTP